MYDSRAQLTKWWSVCQNQQRPGYHGAATRDANTAKCKHMARVSHNTHDLKSDKWVHSREGDGHV